MKENMLLQYSDDLMKVELRSLRGEVLQFVAKYGGSCAAAVENAARKAGSQTELRLQQVLDQLKEASGRLKEEREHLKDVLQNVLKDQAHRLDRLERGCLNREAALVQPETKSFQTRHATQVDQSMQDISAQLENLWEKMVHDMRATSSCVLPAGTGLFFIYAHARLETKSQVMCGNRLLIRLQYTVFRLGGSGALI